MTAVHRWIILLLIWNLGLLLAGGFLLFRVLQQPVNLDTMAATCAEQIVHALQSANLQP